MQKQILLNDAALEIVREGLKQAVNSRQPFYGTAWRAKNDVVPLLGKTGTAQVAKFRERAETKDALEKIPYEQRDHGWFVSAIETVDEPLVITVFCEHAGHASESAVIVVREIAKRLATGGVIAAEESPERDPST
jgi:cell division protein FtsI/penicillin-binding protein 2